MTPPTPSLIELQPCPFCGEHLRVSTGFNPNARCDTDGCWMHDRKMTVPIDDPRQVTAWNTRAALTETEARASDVGQAVEEAFDQVCTQLNKEHREGITSYREMKSGINNASFVRNAALSAPSASGEALGWAKSRAWHQYGIAWHHLEKVSRDELLAEAIASLAAPVAQPEERG